MRNDVPHRVTITQACRYKGMETVSHAVPAETTVALQTRMHRLRLFQSLFVGHTDAYGTYNPVTKQVWQVKCPVTDRVLVEHLKGVRPCGIYPLVKDTLRVAVVDFDHDDTSRPADLVRRLADLGLPAYVEISKSKGFHVWLFVEPPGARARIVRAVLLGVLAEMGQRSVEVFPKQDELSSDRPYGNFINLPLFGRLVREGKTVFVDSAFEPYRDQWAMLASIELASEATIAAASRRWLGKRDTRGATVAAEPASGGRRRTYGLQPCARMMLERGVTSNQRSSCFRLACQLRKAGLPYEYALAILTAWAQKNRPTDGKTIISGAEITEQTGYAYGGQLYSSCGCHDPSILPFCAPDCSLRSAQQGEPQAPRGDEP